MEFKLTSEEAVRMFGIWQGELVRVPGTRAVENGEIKLDSVPSARGAVHTLDGALVYVWYRAANEPTERAIREASVATQVMNLPRQLYTGRLIDIMKGADDTIYFKVMTVERRDESRNGMPAFRSFNPSKGQLIEMTINPTAATVAAAQREVASAQPAPRIQPVVPAAPAVQPAAVQPVPAGMRVRRTQGGR
jgi:hypothetical protein